MEDYRYINHRLSIDYPYVNHRLSLDQPIDSAGFPQFPEVNLAGERPSGATRNGLDINSNVSDTFLKNMGLIQLNVIK